MKRKYSAATSLPSAALFVVGIVPAMRGTSRMWCSHLPRGRSGACKVKVSSRSAPVWPSKATYPDDEPDVLDATVEEDADVLVLPVVDVVHALRVRELAEGVALNDGAPLLEDDVVRATEVGVDRGPACVLEGVRLLAQSDVLLLRDGLVERGDAGGHVETRSVGCGVR